MVIYGVPNKNLGLNHGITKPDTIAPFLQNIAYNLVVQDTTYVQYVYPLFLLQKPIYKVWIFYNSVVVVLSPEALQNIIEIFTFPNPLNKFLD